MPDSSEQLTTGVGFGPTNPLEQPKLGVYAPLDVEGAKSQAAFLAQSLGVVSDHLQRPIMYAEEAEGAGKAKASANQGATDAGDGNVNPDTWNQQNVAYQQAAIKTSVQTSAMDALNKADQLRTTPTAQGGWLGLPINDVQQPDGSTKPGLMTTMDNFFKSTLGGLETDPNAAPVLHPLIQHFYNETTGAAIKKQQDDTLQTAVSTIQARALYSFKNADPSFNWKDSFQQLTTLGASNTQASSMLVHALGEASVLAGNPKLIDQYLPKDGEVPGGVSPGDVPSNATYLADARTRALDAAAKNNKAAINTAESGLVSQAIQKKDITGGLLNYLQTPGADPKTAMSIYNFSRDLIKQQQDAVVDPSASAALTAQIATRQIETPAQLVDAVRKSGLDAKAQAQMLDKGLSDLKSVDALSTDDPQMKAMQSNLEQIYKPSTDALGKFNHPAAATQQAGVMLDFRTEYQGALKKGGVTPELAAQQAHDIVVKKWGDPIESSNKFNQKLPVTDVDRATIIRSRNPQQLHAAGVRAQEVGHIHDLGLINDDDARAAYMAIIQRTQH